MTGNTRRYSIALVTTELRVGGAERCVVRLACGLDPSRFQARVISLAPRPAAADDELVRQLEEHGIPVRFLGDKPRWRLLRYRTELRKRLSDEPTDLVQSFLFHANVLSLFAAPRGLPVSIGVRVADPRPMRSTVERLASQRASAIVCVSRTVADFCAESAKFSRQKLHVIPNGIPLAGLPAAAADLPTLAGRRLLLSVGRLDRQKGYDWLLERLPDWLARLPQHDLVIAGRGSEREPLELQVARLGLADRVHFLGQRDDVPALLAACELLLLPSRWEGMPNVVLEAMASGRPVLASRAEGVLELLGDELAEGQSAEFGDEAAWRERLLGLSGDPARRALLGQQNRRRVEQEFQAEKMVAAYESLFQSILG